MKKYLNIVLSLIFISIISFSYKVIAVDFKDHEAKNFVKQLKIMQGDPNGDFRDNDILSREEFVKITVAVVEPDFLPISSISPYKDVPYYYWSSAYIGRASDLGYFTGYPDGSFKPYENVLPEQVCKVMLKLLGYDTENTTGNWAETQIAFAKDKALLDGVNYEIGLPISRLDTAKIIQNTLLSKVNNLPQFYIEDINYRYYEDATIISDNNVQSGYVLTSVGTFKKGNISDNDIAKKGGIVINKDDEVIFFSPQTQSYKEYIVQQALPDRLSLYDNDNSMLTLMVNKDILVYDGNKQGLYGQIFQTIVKGSTIKFVYDKDGILDYLTLSDMTRANDYYNYIIKSVLPDGLIFFSQDGDKFIKCDNDITVYEGDITTIYQNIVTSLSLGDKVGVYYDILDQIKYLTITRNAIGEPITNINESFKRRFNLSDKTTISRDGILSTIDEIQDYDICYYIQEADTALIYSKKVTGIYENALPNKDNIRKIILSGKQYDISGINAFNKLSGKGNILFGDTIRILLDKDNKIADVFQLSDNESLVGFLMDTGTKTRIDENDNRHIEYYATILLTNGTSEDYVTSDDYNKYIGKVVKVLFNNGNANISSLQVSNTLYGTFNWYDRTFASYEIADTINIIDVANHNDYSIGRGMKVFPQRINNTKLDSGDILYIHKNQHNVITDIILNDYTNDLYEYGIVLKSENISNSMVLQGIYDLNIGGNNIKVQTPNSIYSIYAGNPIKVDFENNLPITMAALDKLKTPISKVDDLYLYSYDKRYLISQDILVYQKVINTSYDGLRYKVIPISKIDYSKNLTAYYDKAEENGGRIRVILVS